MKVDIRELSETVLLSPSLEVRCDMDANPNLNGKQFKIGGRGLLHIDPAKQAAENYSAKLLNKWSDHPETDPLRGVHRGRHL